MNVRRIGVPLAAATAAALAAQDPAAGGQDPAALESLSLQQLLQVEVEVSSRRDESWFQAASAVFVLTEEQIQASGMRSVAELLRLVPGLIIAQDVPGAYSYSSRAGEYDFAGLLILIDGQRLYPTLLRREWFQAVDVPVENIARIEVVKGPGGARWGDKTAQGVVNIVTKRAADVPGAMVSATVGTEERLSGMFRYGGSLSDDWQFHAYGRGARRDGGYPEESGDRWSHGSAGARFDGSLGAGTTLSIDGEYHDSFVGDSYEISPGDSELNSITGGRVKARLRTDHGDGSVTELLAGFSGYDQDDRYFTSNVLVDKLIYREEFYDLTVHHRMSIGDGHDLHFGAGFRQLTVENSWLMTPQSEYNTIRADVFVAWDWQVADELLLTLGGNTGFVESRWSDGWDLQPDARLAWTPSADTTIWAAVSGKQEPDQLRPDGIGGLTTRKSTDLVAYECGARHRVDERWLFSLDLFHYEIDDQIAEITSDPGTGADVYDPRGHSKATGGEFHAAWRPADQLHLSAWWAVTVGNAQHFPAGSYTIEQEVPQNRAGVTAAFEVCPTFTCSSHLLYTEQHGGIPTHLRWDVKFAWRPDRNTEASLVFQDILDPHHPEYIYLEEPERGVYFLLSHTF